MNHLHLRTEPRRAADQTPDQALDAAAAAIADAFGHAKSAAIATDSTDPDRDAVRLLLAEGVLSIGAAAGGVDFVIEGDVSAFWWLQNACQPAGAGFVGNEADATDGSGNRLVLRPEQPDRHQAPGSKLAHRVARHRT